MIILIGLPPLAPGKALSFTSAMSVLVKKFPEQDNGVAYIFQGSYFLAAPWPIRSPIKARESFEKAVKVCDDNTEAGGRSLIAALASRWGIVWFISS